jgi:hypothetical protein
MANTTYTTTDDFRERISDPPDDAGSEGLMQQLLNTAAYLFDRVTRRPPVGLEAFSEVASSARYFDDALNGVISIDDATAVTAVTRNGAALTAGTDYNVSPYNELPKTSIVLSAGGVGAKAIAVTGTWGYCTQANRPAIVKELVLTQAERLYEQIGMNPVEIANLLRDPMAAIDPMVLGRAAAAGLIREDVEDAD